MTERLHKYPRTPHLAGSNIQPGDDAPTVPVAALAGRWLVVEEKLDGANAGLSFLPDGELRLQSRGHFLTGGPRERHFALFKTWAATHRAALFAALGSRYVLYGEWLFAQHTLFYDALPHYFLEFDALDTATGEFLATERRAQRADWRSLRSAAHHRLRPSWAGFDRRLLDRGRGAAAPTRAGVAHRVPPDRPRPAGRAGGATPSVCPNPTYQAGGI